jgi:hypothetical protein
MKAILFTAILCCTTLLSATTPRPNLTGTVKDANGNPLADVTVMVYHAGVKVGYSTFCPSCYIDCGKRVVTDADGSFEIKDLAPDLWFTLLAARDGYVPGITKSIDPVKSSTVALQLASKPPTADFSGTVRGRVVGSDGSPVADAIIDPTGINLNAKQVSAIFPAGTALSEGEHSVYGTLKGLQPIAVTNKQGEFEISYNQPTSKMLLKIEGRGLAPKFVVMETGAQRHSVTLTDGATITGRLIANGKPAPNIQIGLIPKERGGFSDNLKINGSPYEVVRIGTDANGRFVIPNAPAPVDWYIYATIDSVSSLGATSPIAVHTSRDGEYLQTADLVIGRGFKVKGTVVVNDNKPIPEGMHITIGSETIWDSKTIPLPADGHFEFNNIPPGKYTIWASVKGYYEKTPQYGPAPFSVDHDIDNFTTTIYPGER